MDSSLENATGSISKAPDGESRESNNENTDIDSESTVLIAYFSWSGNTKQLAEMIQKQMGGELFEIKPETPYTDDINELSGISLQEQRDNIRPALSGAAPDMSRYDVIFVGFPNWWNNMPMPVFTFLEGYDFSGKTVIPFTTYGNGVWGKSVDSIRNALPDAIIVDGLAIQEHNLQDAPAEVSEWLQELGLIQ
ncbi:MAG: flavodoxin [Subdoligranulum sp.]|nr:flavodoxin [Subdoligranulum sp.]